MSTILAFDFGLHHIGVATGNTTTKTCSPQKSIQARDGIPNADALDKLVRDWLPAVFVVGLPLNMDGTEQEMTFKARKFGNRLKEKYKKEVVFIDERLTSASAKGRSLSAVDSEPLQKTRELLILCPQLPF